MHPRYRSTPPAAASAGATFIRSRFARGAACGPSARPSHCAGFTIIEVLVAAMILSIGLVGVSSMIYFGVISHQKSAHYTIAGERAVQEMERIRDAGYLGAVVDTWHFPSSIYQIVDAHTVRFSVADLPSATGTITINEDTEAQAINPDTGQPYENMKRVTVTVAWGGSRRVSGVYNVATLITNRP